MILLPTGGILIDTPGMRELQIWSEADELDALFEDVKALESQCKFNDCSHNSEPGCAINAALENGTLDPKRYENYLIMAHEVAYLNQRKKQKEKALTKRESLLNKIERQSRNHKI